MNGRELVFRRARCEDYDGMIALWTRAGLKHQPSGRDSRQNLQKEMEDPDVDILLALDGDRIIGSVIGTNDGRKGWVNRLAVDPIHRGEGVAMELVEMVEDCFESRSLKIICCLINSENGPSQSLFERIGYECRPEVVYYSKRKDHDV